MPSEEAGHAKLPGQDNGTGFPIIEQNGRAVALFVDFAALLLPASVLASVVEGDLAQDIPVVGQDSFFTMRSSGFFMALLDACPLKRVHQPSTGPLP